MAFRRRLAADLRPWTLVSCFFLFLIGALVIGLLAAGGLAEFGVTYVLIFWGTLHSVCQCASDSPLFVCRSVPGARDRSLPRRAQPVQGAYRAIDPQSPEPLHHALRPLAPKV